MLTKPAAPSATMAALKDSLIALDKHLDDRPATQCCLGPCACSLERGIVVANRWIVYVAPS
jgi:hypothetical protein